MEEQYGDMMNEEILQSYGLWEEEDSYETMQMQMQMQMQQLPPPLLPPPSQAPFISHHSNINTWNILNLTNNPEPAGLTSTKTKRRRSRSSASASAAAAASTTFLNASISNFRAVVQQHTGCHNSESSPKGPITLCFATPAHPPPSPLDHHYYYC